jgi:hypothetical protein
MENVVRELRRDFSAAISSDQNDVTLDPSITNLREKISDPGFLGPFSIYSRSQLRKMGDFLLHINNAGLKHNPLRVALAVDSVLKLFDSLELTVKRSAAANPGGTLLMPSAPPSVACPLSTPLPTHPIP